MKRVLAKVSSAIKSAKFRKFLVLFVIFAAGVACGFVLKSELSNAKDTQSVSSRTVPQTTEERIQRATERLKESYDRAKQRIKNDVEAKRIDQKKADEINKKLDEIYNYRKNNQNQTSDEKRQELQNKRKEWREWLEKNSVSTRYFIGVI